MKKICQKCGNEKLGFPVLKEGEDSRYQPLKCPACQTIHNSAGGVKTEGKATPVATGDSDPSNPGNYTTKLFGIKEFAEMDEATRRLDAFIKNSTSEREKCEPYLHQEVLFSQGKYREAKSAIIKKVLDLTGGNVARAAKILGVGRTTLFEAVRRWDLKTGE